MHGVIAASGSRRLVVVSGTDVLFNISNNLYHYNPSTEVLTFLKNYNFSTDLAHTNTKLWLYGNASGTIDEYDITLNPFTSTSSRTITNIYDSSALCAIDNTTLVTYYSTNNSIYEADITTTTASNTLKFSLGNSNRHPSGDFIYTTDGKLIITLNDTSDSKRYVSQYDYSTGALEFDLEVTAETDNPYGIFQFNSKTHIVNDDGKIYTIESTSPYTKTLVNTISTNNALLGASQIPSQNTESFTPNFLLPTVKTNSGSFNTSTDVATLNGNVISDGGSTITERGFYYEVNDSTIDNTNSKKIVTGTTGLFSGDVPVLQQPSSITLYYRAYAINSAGENISGITESIVIPPA